MNERAEVPADRASLAFSGGETIGAWSIAVMSAAMLTILLLNPIWDFDIFWQLKLGEMALARGWPIAHEPFAVSHLGEPLPALAWLGQIVMAKMRMLAGWTGLRIFDAICWLGGFLLVAFACRRRGGSALGIVVALGVAFLVAFPTASIRPQTFAVLGFGIVLAVRRLELRPWLMTWCLAPLLLLWPNLHPSVSIAAIALGTYAAVDWARFVLGKGSPPWETSALTLIAAAAVLATPDGWAALKLSGDNANASVAMGVSEWLPLWDPINRGSMLPLAVLCLIVAGLLILNRRRIELSELALAIVLLAMTVLINRFVLFWAIALIPVIVRALTPLPARRRTFGLRAPMLLCAVAVMTPMQHPTKFSPNIPLAAIDRLHREGFSGVIFAPAPWGGPLIDIGYPRWRVAYDGRFYRFSPEEWQLYRNIARGEVPLAEIERRYGPAAFVLDPRSNASLMAELRTSLGWRQIWSDRSAAVFKREGTAAP